MDEYINATTLLKEIDYAFHTDTIGKKDVINLIINLPAADVTPVVHGHWNYRCPTDGVSYRYCSKCLSIVYDSLYVSKNYCPNCGAKMDGGAD